jgi:hypothetical protein
MGYYENWQREKYGNVLPTTKSNLRQDEDEVEPCEFDNVATDTNVFSDDEIKTKNEQ